MLGKDIRTAIYRVNDVIFALSDKGMTHECDTLSKMVRELLALAHKCDEAGVTVDA